MTLITTFYFSRVVGCKVYNRNGILLGRLIDLAVDLQLTAIDDNQPFRPKLKALYVKHSSAKKFLQFERITLSKENGAYMLTIDGYSEIDANLASETLLLGQAFLDQQIVDINGRKVVRVNDIRLVFLADAVYTIAVDVGIEGLLRRLGVAKQVSSLLGIFNRKISSHFILMDDVAAVDNSNFSIKLSKTATKLNRLHPSDLADIIEDLGKSSKTSIFSHLDEEMAADVLEELEPHEQVLIIESLPIDKAADVLEKMPANEAADIIDELEFDKAEQLLCEMEPESSEEVRELLEYSDNAVGSIMTTEVLSFTETAKVDDILNHIRESQPERDMLYSIFVVDKQNKLVGTVSVRDLLVSKPNTILKDIMVDDPVSVLDTSRMYSLAELVSKYNLLAIPVTDENDILEGMVVIDDVVDDLLGKRRMR